MFSMLQPKSPLKVRLIHTFCVDDNLNHLCVGTAISLYGTTGPDHGRFSVSLDGSGLQFLDGWTPQHRAYNLLVTFSSVQPKL
jgi:hypothetical protein